MRRTAQALFMGVVLVLTLGIAAPTQAGKADPGKGPEVTYRVKEMIRGAPIHGANGLALTDAMALAIAAQACLPLLHMHGTSGDAVRDPLKLLDWYGDFVGIVVQPGAVVARRKTTDGAGVVHHYDEVLAGEAMEGGPVMLSWQDVRQAGRHAGPAYNVVIHEFAHVLDLADGASDGVPLLPRDLPRAEWLVVLRQAHEPAPSPEMHEGPRPP